MTLSVEHFSFGADRDVVRPHPNGVTALACAGRAMVVTTREGRLYIDGRAAYELPLAPDELVVEVSVADLSSKGRLTFLALTSSRRLLKCRVYDGDGGETTTAAQEVDHFVTDSTGRWYAYVANGRLWWVARDRRPVLLGDAKFLGLRYRHERVVGYLIATGIGEVIAFDDDSREVWRRRLLRCRALLEIDDTMIAVTADHALVMSQASGVMRYSSDHAPGLPIKIECSHERRCASIGASGERFVWDLTGSAPKLIGALNAPLVSPWTSGFTPEGLYAIGGQDGTVTIGRIDDLVSDLDAIASVWSMAPIGDKVLQSGSSGAITVAHWRRPLQQHVLHRSRHWINSIRPVDERRLCFVDAGGHVGILDLSTPGIPARIVAEIDEWLNAVVALPDERLAVAGESGKIHIVGHDGRLHGQWQAHDGWVNAMVTSYGCLVSAGGEGRLHSWTPQGKLIDLLATVDAQFTSVVAGSGAVIAATLSGDVIVRLHDEDLLTTRLANTRIWQVAVQGDAVALATSSGCRVLDLHTLHPFPQVALDAEVGTAVCSSPVPGAVAFEFASRRGGRARLTLGAR
jgi:hypothetical protein